MCNGEFEQVSEGRTDSKIFRASDQNRFFVFHLNSGADALETSVERGWETARSGLVRTATRLSA